MKFSQDALIQHCKNGYAPPNRGPPGLQIRNLKKKSTPEPLTQIQNNFTELFLIIPSTKIAQMVTLR